MNDKEKKLREALNEYFGKEVGDVKRVLIQPVFNQGAPDLNAKRIIIVTKTHKPTFEEKRNELVDQLDKDLKEIDGGFDVKIEGDKICIWYYAGRLCELYGKDDMRFYSTYLKVKKMTNTMDAISGFSWNLRQLKEQYEDETI